MVLVFMTITLNSCSSDGISIEKGSYSVESKTNALASFDQSFQKNFDYLVSTRCSVTNADEQYSDNISALAGRKICANLQPNTDEVLSKFGITNQILLDVYNENKAEFEGETTFEEFKCFTALTIYDTYKSDFSKEAITRASAMDIGMCIATGLSYQQLFELSGTKIAQFAVKKLASRLVPYVGWGIASAAYCLSKL